MFPELSVPVIVAPMAGGVSTPELVAAVAEAGGFGYLAAGYQSADALAEQIAATRKITDKAFGMNIFVPGRRSEVDVRAYAQRLRADAEHLEVDLGEPAWDDDGYAEKLDLVISERVPVVSFTFGLPTATDLARLRNADITVVLTATTPGEARQAAASGADLVCLQGYEAGGHRATFGDATTPQGTESYGLLALLRLVRAELDLPLIVSGGLVHGADIAAVLVAGAAAAQCGTAFLRCAEAGTPPAHREALAEATRPTAVTRAFTGRQARSLVNRFLAEHDRHAPDAYPHVHHMTKPLRAAATRAGDPDGMSLWAGQTYRIAEDAGAAATVARMMDEMRAALAPTAGWFG